MALTVTRLARACGLARGTILYYESIGLLTRPRRSAGNYRLYSDRDLERLRQIRSYRDAGLNLDDIRSILDKPLNQAAGVLERRLVELTGEIARLREHQRSIGRLLQSTNQLRRMSMVTKEKWVEVMRAAGFPTTRCIAGMRSSKSWRQRSIRSSWSFCGYRMKKFGQFAPGAGGYGSKSPYCMI
jgi:DNA-binding transcriptional MerR regulator